MEYWKDYILIITATASIGFGFWSNLQTRNANKATRKENEERRKLLENEKKKANQNQLALQIVERIITIFNAIRNIRDSRFQMGPTYWRITEEDYRPSAFIDEKQKSVTILKTEQLNLELDSLRTKILLGENINETIDEFLSFVQGFISNLETLEYEGYDEDDKKHKVETFITLFNNDESSQFNQNFMKKIKNVFIQLSPFLNDNLENFEHFRGYGVDKSKNEIN